MLVDNCYLLDYNAIKQLQEILILAHFIHLYIDQHLILLPNSFIISEDNTSSLHPVFTLKRILLSILLG